MQITHFFLACLVFSKHKLKLFAGFGHAVDKFWVKFGVLSSINVYLAIDGRDS